MHPPRNPRSHPSTLAGWHPPRDLHITRTASMQPPQLALPAPGPSQSPQTLELHPSHGNRPLCIMAQHNGVRFMYIAP